MRWLRMMLALAVPVLAVPVLAISILAIAGSSAATAEQLALTGHRHWVVIASSGNVNDAIGIARLYDQADPMGVLPAEHAAFAAIVARRAVAAAGPGGVADPPASIDRPGIPAPRVVSTGNGIYSIVLGPVDAPSIDAVRAGYRGPVPLPPDAFLDNGAHDKATVWLPTHPVLDAASLGDKETAELSTGSFRISVAFDDQAASPQQATPKQDPSKRVVHLSGGDADDAPFDVRFNIDRPFVDDGDLARLVWLDHTAPYPQLVLQQRAGAGTSKTSIFTKTASGRWIAWNAGVQDETGFRFDDPDKDGNTRLIGQDVAFIGDIKIGRSFARNPVDPADALEVGSDMFEQIVKGFRAGDFNDAFGLPKPAPPFIQSIAGENFWNQSANDASRVRIMQDVAGFEFRARLHNTLWRSNEFLAGWLTASALTGAGEAHWPLLLQLYDRAEDRPDGGSTSAMAATFPQRLVSLWKRLGYRAVLDNMARSIQELGSHKDAVAAGTATPTDGKSPTAPELVLRGSAVFAAEGVFVTYRHLIEGCGKIYVGATRVVDPARQVVEATLRTRKDGSSHDNSSNDDPSRIDPSPDDPGLVLLDASLYSDHTLLIAEDEPALGAPVIGFGYPKVEPLTATGNFAVSHVVRTLHDDDDRYLQFTAPFWQGSAGGPLLDEHGALVGLINGGDQPELPGGMFERVSYALQSAVVAQFLADNGVALRAPASDDKRSPVEIATAAASLTARVYCDR